MSRFLIVSFAGLALAFYELSGGADFEPPAPPDSLIQRQETLADSKRNRNRIVSSPAEIRLGAPVLTPYQGPPPAAIKTASGNRDTPAPGTPRGTGLNTTQHSTPEPQRISLSLPATGLQIGALEGGLASITAATPQPVATVAAPEPVGDLRRVRASRANVRLGPGTRFPVLVQLLAGDQVRVLNDDPSGWALLETPKTGQVGWIAASLLSAKGS
ncbi:SH3 domain-containing protein [Epibacterium sp. Ofav1-8]|uniref:SH3 domain-containing protein n=1 Tax=Epibacterium sp. Ofav1-8 TaxID=2917735 RepID=UPI001EF51369|nr:SH3 domain-containing protein [Epibacterium sp. Ofav1-8]MCG7624146.1 SH3 domain-containing protein [Epibacterium sp. Ofav1-8]